MHTAPTHPAIAKEFEGALRGDVRRTRRVMAVAEDTVAASDRTLPERLRAPGALQGAYRLFRNPAVLPAEVLAPHVARTVLRAAACPVVLALHDTTELRFGGEATRDGLGALSDHGQGFHAHVTLAVTPDGAPLGVVNLWAWRREARATNTSPRSTPAPRIAVGYGPDRESLRWFEGVEATEARLADHAKVLHVMDREGDCLELIAPMQDEGAAFVIRVCQDRRLEATRRAVGVAKRFAAPAPTAVRSTCEVAFGARPAASRQGRRSARRAVLAVRAGAFVLSPSHRAVYRLPAQRALHFVEVREVDPPAGEDPILWRLVTTEPIDTDAQLAAIIAVYRCRGILEEYFKVLQTGCRDEALQLRSGHALLNALCLLMPVAWSRLHLRWMERAQPDARASEILTTTPIDVLVRHHQHRARPLANPPTVRQALWAIGGLGGHLSQNGPPGVRTLLRGLHTLLHMEAAVLARDGPAPAKM